MKRIILILAIVAMTLGIAGSAIAQEEAPSYEELTASMGLYEDPEAPGCYFAFGMYVCAPPSTETL